MISLFARYCIVVAIAYGASALLTGRAAARPLNRADHLSIICDDGADASDSETVAQMKKNPGFAFDVADVQCAIEFEKVLTLDHLLNEVRDGARISPDERIVIAPVSGTSTVPDRSISLFEYALLEGAFRSAEVLRHHGAIVYSGGPGAESPLVILLDGLLGVRLRPLSPTGSSSFSPEDYARAIALARNLLADGVDPNRLSLDGRSPVGIAYDMSELVIGREFLAVSTPASLRASASDATGRPAYASIAVNGTAEDFAVVKSRLSEGEWLNALTFEYALERRNLRVVRFFLNRGFSPNTRLPHYASALHALSEMSRATPLSTVEERAFQVSATSLLIAAGADTGMRNENGETPLDSAKAHDNFSVMQRLISGDGN